MARERIDERAFVRAYATGIQHTLKQLAQFEPKLQKKVVRKAGRAGAKIVQQRAIALAPEGEDTEQPGRLKKAIKVRAAKGPRGRRLPKDKAGAAVVIDKKTMGGGKYYAAWVELGTKRIEAREFLKEAAWTSTAAVTRAFSNELRNGFKRLAAEARAAQSKGEP